MGAEPVPGRGAGLEIRSNAVDFLLPQTIHGREQARAPGSDSQSPTRRNRPPEPGKLRFYIDSKKDAEYADDGMKRARRQAQRLRVAELEVEVVEPALASLGRAE